MIVCLVAIRVDNHVFGRQSCHSVFLYVHGRYGYSPVTVYFCVYPGDIWVDGPMYFVCTQEIWVGSPVTVYFYVNTGDSPSPAT